MGSSFCFWCSWTEWEHWVNIRFYLFLSGVNQKGEGGRWVQDFLVTPAFLQVSWCIQCVWSVCRWLSHWWLFFCSVGGWCYSGWWVWDLRILAQFPGNEMSPGMFQDFMNGYIALTKTHEPNRWKSWSSCDSDSGLPLRRKTVRFLWVVTFRFMFYKINVMRQWVHKICQFSRGLWHWQSEFNYRYNGILLCFSILIFDSASIQYICSI